MGSPKILDRTLHWSPAMSPALVGGFFTTEPPRNPTFHFLIIDKDNQVASQLCGSSFLIWCSYSSFWHGNYVHPHLYIPRIAYACIVCLSKHLLNWAEFGNWTGITNCLFIIHSLFLIHGILIYLGQNVFIQLKYSIFPLFQWDVTLSHSLGLLGKLFKRG